ncbi:DYW family of nucleic acid deaminases-domain-containing protein [Cercophora newfieldiana]|uniref:DYW family of nucleic acid deaminases-domain-containing protein n=1 Tax=Cercophora newfieldiana TaxID=92897 RepID=A0AA39Y9J9_9PEZI|nr:DYW family of nucleic acid deaminases-domain-containing protein [Cercophora newfieldiana]
MAVPTGPRSQDLPLAHVQWWNGSTVKVRCPNCDRIHGHGFRGYHADQQRRGSQCGDPRLYGEYQMHFPFGVSYFESFANYEINKERGVFVAAGVDLSQHFPVRDGRVDKLRKRFVEEANRRPKWTDAKEEREIRSKYWKGPLVEKIFDEALADMVIGKIEAVQRFLETSADANLFIHGVEADQAIFPSDHEGEDDDSDGENAKENKSTPCRMNSEVIPTGRTTLHLAAAESHPEIVELLLTRGADPNVRDVEGKTPLSEAALWGRLENVRILLEHGADPLLECIRDDKTVLAVDFARNEGVNTELRRRSVYKEDTRERNIDRRAVINMLARHPRSAGMITAGPTQTTAQPAGFVFTRSTGAWDNSLTLMANFVVPSEYKTIGVLFRGSDFPSVAAMSGWAHNDEPGANIHISGKDWTNEVRQLCRHIGHRLAPHEYDQGEPGKFNACHAEKQLIAYFVSKHVFLQHEQMSDDPVEELVLSMGLTSIAGELFGQEQDETRWLSKVRPPISLKKATIMVCRLQCWDCESFVERVNQSLGVEITVVGSSVV